MTLRILLLIFSISILSACGGGGGSDPTPDGGSDGDDDIVNIDGDGDQDIDEQNPVVELQIVKTRNWVAVEGSTLELIPYGRVTDSGEDFSERTKGDIYWTIISGSEYASIEQVQRRANVTALIPCPDDNPYCVEVELKLDSSTGEIYTETVKLLVKQTSDNLPPEAVIDLSQIAIDGIQVVSIEDKTISALGGTTITLSSDGSFDLEGTVTGYLWDVPAAINSSDKKGDVLTITLPENEEEQNYQISLEVRDDNEAHDSETITLKVLPVLPVAVASTSANNGFGGEKIQLIGSNSSSSGSDITSFEWVQVDILEPYVVQKFVNADDEVATVTLPTLLEEDEGKEIVLNFQLTVTNEYGKTSTDRAIVTLISDTQNKAPLFNLEATGFEEESSILSTTQANEQTEICVIAEASDSDTGMSHFDWNWEPEEGEGKPFSQQSEVQISPTDDPLRVKACFTTPEQKYIDKKYRLTITAFDKEQQGSTQKYLMTVKHVTLPPQISFQASSDNDTVSITVTATDQDEDGKISELVWTKTGEQGTHEVPEDDLGQRTATNTFSFDYPIIKTGTTLTFQVQAIDDEGSTSSQSTFYSIGGTNLTPQSVTINYVEGESVLSWQPQPHAIGYRVYKGVKDGVENFDVYEPKSATTFEHAITDCLDTETCYYYVTSIYPDGNVSEPSAKTTLLPAPAEIVLIDETTRPGDEKYLTIKWPEVDGAESYQVIWTRNNGTGTELSTSAYSGITSINKNDLTSSVDNEITWLEFVHTDARAIFEEPNQYTYQILAVSEDNSKGQPSSESSFYALAKQWKYIQDIPSHRIGAASVEYDGKVYFFGGGSGMSGFMSAWIAPRTTVLEYTPATNKWKYLEPMETPRYGAAACVLNNKIYVSGGMSGASIIDQSIEVYNTTTNQWQTGELPAMGAPRAHHSCTTIDNNIYLFGGIDSTFTPRADYDKINSEGTSAGVVAPNGLFGRFNHTALAFDNPFVASATTVILFGGEVTENDSDIQFLLIDSEEQVLAGEYFSNEIELTTVLNGKVTQSITPISDYQQTSATDIDYEYKQVIEVYGLTYDYDESGNRLKKQKISITSIYEDRDSSGILSNYISGAGESSSSNNPIQLTYSSLYGSTEFPLTSAEDIIYINDIPHIFWGKTERHLVPVSNITEDYTAGIVQKYNAPQIYKSKLLKVDDKLLQVGTNYYSFPGTTLNAFFSTPLDDIGNWTEHTNNLEISRASEYYCITNTDHKIMLFGGDSDYYPTHRLYFDNFTGLTEWGNENPPAKLYEHSCESLNGKSYVFGGHTQDYSINASVFEYSPAASAFSNGTWNELNDSDIQSPSPRNDICTVSGENGIYLIGGTDADDFDTNQAEIFKPTPGSGENYWQPLPPMNYTRSRENSACLTLNDRLWVFGSYENEAVESLSLQDPANGWSVESEIIEGPETQTNIFQYDLFDGIVHEGKFYLLGGVEYRSTTSVSVAKRVFY